MMKKKTFFALLLLMGTAAPTAYAQSGDDSLKLADLQEVVVKGVRGQKNAPYAVANIRKSELQEFSKTGEELPFLFARTPGVLAWSENGVGTGTVYMRIRGAGDSRINVTLDGVPLNSPEDQCVFWANMNSYASLLGSVQIQRGVGTSTNGDGAFGGTVALATATPNLRPSAEVTASCGSYATFNDGASFSTGLIFSHLIFDGAYHETNTDGFIHGTDGRSGSYYGGLTWLGDNFKLSYKNIGNFEKTGQAWNGVVAGNDDASLMDWGIRTYTDMYNHGLGEYNSLCEMIKFDEDNWEFPTDVNGNYKTQPYTMRDGSLWSRTTDNFYQNHNILNGAWSIGDRWTANASLHYTYGYGYYKEFRYNNKLSKFGLSFTDADGNAVKRTDFVRRKGLCQNTYGAVAGADYKDERWDIIGGLSLQRFHGNHFGYLSYIANEEVSAKYLADGDYKYYDSDADKGDYSGFVKAACRVAERWTAFADVQYRHVSYTTDGINDKFYEEDSKYYNQELDIDKNYDFFNPKAGITYSLGSHRAYASIALSHREPERNNFTDNGSYPAPKAEKLYDYEMGYQYDGEKVRAGANIYYMRYKDQFVQTGQVSDIGENLTTNIDKSYRLGMELTAAYDIATWLTIEGNAALSENKISDFTEYVDNWDGDPIEVKYDNSTLAFSPAAILNGFICFRKGGLSATWHTDFVSRQYLDNTENSDRSLPCYSASDISLNYSIKEKSWLGPLKEVVLGCNLNNIFNRHYASSGWVYSAVSDDYGYTLDNRYYQIGFIPQAGFTALGYFTIRF